MHPANPSGGLPRNARAGLQVVVGAALLAAAFWAVSSHGGRLLQARFFGTYVRTAATTESTYLGIANCARRCEPLFLRLNVRYDVGAKTYRGGYLVRTWDTINKQEAQPFIDSYLHAGDPVDVYVDPSHPETSVLEPADQVHLWFVFLVFCPALIAAIGLVILGVASWRPAGSARGLKPAA